MKHSDIQSRMASYLDGELSLDARALFDAHLDQCDGCSRELAEMRETIRLLRGLPSPEPPQDFVAAVMQRIEAGEAQPSWFGRVLDSLGQVLVPRFVIPATAVAAGLTLTVMSGDLDLRRLDLRGRAHQAEFAGIPAEGPRSQALQTREAPAAVRLAQSTVRPRVGRTESVRVAKPTPPVRYRRQSGSGSFLFRVNNDPLGPVRRPAGESDLASRMFLMSRPQQVGPYLGASAAPSIALGTGSLRVSAAAAHGAPPKRGLAPVAVSRFDAVPAVGDDALSPQERRIRELDSRLNFLTKDPTGFAQQQAQSTLAEQELWLAELAKRAEELGEVERVISALEGSGEQASLQLAREFEAAVERNDAALATADAQADTQ